MPPPPTGGTTGLLKTIANGSGTGASQGRVVNGALVPQAYQASTTTSKKSESIHITLANGNVKEFGIEPEPPVDADRIPVTDAHKKGVFDPMTSSLLRVPGNGDPLTPEACHTGAAVFDGRMRYDLKLDFKRMETVKADKGYYGPAVVCSVYFTPVAGYIPDRPVIKYLAGQRNIEIAFAPIVGTRILVPFRMVIPTPLGTAMLEATSFRDAGHAAAKTRRRSEASAAFLPHATGFTPVAHHDLRKSGRPDCDEGGAKRRMRGSISEHQSGVCGDRPLTRLAAATAPAIHPLPQGRGCSESRHLINVACRCRLLPSVQCMRTNPVDSQSLLIRLLPRENLRNFVLKPSLVEVRQT